MMIGRERKVELPFQNHLDKAYNLVPVVPKVEVRLDLEGLPNTRPVVLKKIS